MATVNGFRRTVMQRHRLYQHRQRVISCVKGIKSLSAGQVSFPNLDVSVWV